jgi:hypothetical protein
MSVTVTVHKRSKQVLIDLGNHDRRFTRGIREALHDIGQLHVEEIQRLLNTGPKTGRIYKRPGRPDHRASAPGQAPATDTGDLSKSVDYEARADQLEVGDRESYGRWLEDGTKRMKPRPHVGVAANNIAGDAVVLLGRRVVERLGPGARRR